MSSAPGSSGYSDWMAGLPESLHSVPLCHLAIPGSHNSATFCMDSSAEFAADAPATLRDGPPIVQAMAKGAVKNWSECQSLSLSEQMDAGVRYLDLRVALRPSTGSLHVVHSLYGPSVEQCVQEIDSFLSNHKKEIILLDFRQFYGMTDDDHRVLLNVLLSRFEQRMCPLLDTESLTLDTLWSSELQLVVFYHHPLVAEYMQFWPGTCVPSFWPNTADTDTMLAAVEENYSRGRCCDSFHVTQGVLTPSMQFIMTNLAGRLKDDLAQKAAQPFVNWLKGKTAGRNGINICIVDFIELAAFIPSVLELNRKISL